MPKLKGSDLAPVKKRQSAASRAFVLAQKHATVWRDDSGSSFLTVEVGDHHEHLRLTLDPKCPAGQWLGLRFYQDSSQSLPSTAKGEVLSMLQAEAALRGTVYPSGRRIRRWEGTVYLDLADDQWRVVEIQPGKPWAIRRSQDVPVRFWRPAGAEALPVPVKGGAVGDLARFINAATEADFQLVVSWVLAALAAAGQYPVLALDGEPGSAKSTATRFLRRLVDPNISDLRRVPKDEQSLFVTVQHSHVLALDNLSTPPDWLADTLCTLATGAGFASRALYTDGDETILKAAAPIIVNGINSQLSRSDLADRALAVTLHRIPDEARRYDDELDAEFRAAQPRILGALLDVLSHALGREPQVRLARAPRMATFARLMVAAEPALGWQPGAFLKALFAAQVAAAAEATAGRPLVAALERLALAEHVAGRDFRFTGTASELLAQIVNLPVQGKEHLPRSANSLGKALRREAAPLRLLGWAVDPDRWGSRSREIFLMRTVAQPLLENPAPDKGGNGATAATGESPSFQEAV